MRVEQVGRQPSDRVLTLDVDDPVGSPRVVAGSADEQPLLCEGVEQLGERRIIVRSRQRVLERKSAVERTLETAQERVRPVDADEVVIRPVAAPGTVAARVQMVASSEPDRVVRGTHAGTVS